MCIRPKLLYETNTSDISEQDIMKVQKKNYFHALQTLSAIKTTSHRLRMTTNTCYSDTSAILTHPTPRQKKGRELSTAGKLPVAAYRPAEVKVIHSSSGVDRYHRRYTGKFLITALHSYLIRILGCSPCSRLRCWISEMRRP